MTDKKFSRQDFARTLLSSWDQSLAWLLNSSGQMRRMALHSKCRGLVFHDRFLTGRYAGAKTPGGHA